MCDKISSHTIAPRVQLYCESCALQNRCRVSIYYIHRKDTRRARDFRGTLFARLYTAAVICGLVREKGAGLARVHIHLVRNAVPNRMCMCTRMEIERGRKVKMGLDAQ